MNRIKKIGLIGLMGLMGLVGNVQAQMQALFGYSTFYLPQEDRPYIEGTDVLIYGNGASMPLDQLGRQYGDDLKGGD